MTNAADILTEAAGEGSEGISSSPTNTREQGITCWYMVDAYAK